jgi:hypothetical protein
MFVLEWIAGTLCNMGWVFRHWQNLYYKQGGFMDEDQESKNSVLTVGLKKFYWIPSLIFFLSGSWIYDVALKESSKLKIPNIAIIGSQVKLNDTLYPLRGSDSEWEGIRFYLKLFCDARDLGKTFALNKASRFTNYFGIKQIVLEDKTLKCGDNLNSNLSTIFMRHAFSNVLWLKSAFFNWFDSVTKRKIKAYENWQNFLWKRCLNYKVLFFLSKKLHLCFNSSMSIVNKRYKQKQNYKLTRSKLHLLSCIFVLCKKF